MKNPNSSSATLTTNIVEDLLEWHPGLPVAPQFHCRSSFWIQRSHKLEELLDQYLETSGPRNLGTTWIKNDGHFGTAFAENKPTIVERDR